MDHKFTEEDLLSFVHAKASAETASGIQEQMDRDVAFRAEIALMRGLKSTLAEAADQNQPGEFGWHRLNAAIDREEAAERRPAMVGGAGINRARGWRAAAAVLVVIVLGQTIYIAFDPENPAQYQTASAIVETHVLAARFSETATIAEIGALIRGLGGRIIDGPAATGFYRLSFDSDTAMQAAEPLLTVSPLVTQLAVE